MKKSEFKSNFQCKECDKYYSSASSLCNHNKKFHDKSNISNDKPNISNNKYNDKSNISNDKKNKDINYKCKYCFKNYKHYQSRWKHEQICKDRTTILEENEKLKKENEELKKYNQLVTTNSTNPKINTELTNSTNNKINNGTINNTLNKNQNNIVNNNNTITINQIGKEPITFRTKDIKMIANDGLNGPITCVRRLNFHKKKPSNHSYCTTSLEGDYCTAINHETQKPEKVPKKEIIDKVFESAYNFIETIAFQIKEDESLREILSKKEIKEIERIVANKNKFYEKKNWKTFYNSVNSMSYNYRDLVLSTWKLLKPLGKNLISESSDSDSDSDSNSDSDSDNEIREVTEFYDDTTTDSDSYHNNDSDSDSDSESNLKLFN
jgi:hypothetical protein